jgi:putative peptide zinc metalloprotease protein
VSQNPFPRVRRNLRYSRHVEQGRPYFVVKDPLSLKYFRFGETETWLMQRMDGSSSLEDIAAEMHAERGVRPSTASLETFVNRLKELGLAERTAAEKSLMLMEALRSQRKLRLQGNGNTLFRMRFSVGDPNPLFDQVIPYIRFFFTPWFVAASAALFIGYLVLLMTHWTQFTSGIAALYTPEQYTLGFFITLYTVALVIFAIHELGHGLACKHFGGEVHEIGAMLLYFRPAFFCNVNDAWTFEKRSHRLWVTFAGGWIEFVIGALGAVVWVLTEPGTSVNQIAFLVALISAGLGLVMNFNPLLPLDGY